MEREKEATIGNTRCAVIQRGNNLTTGTDSLEPGQIKTKLKHEKRALMEGEREGIRKKHQTCLHPRLRKDGAVASLHMSREDFSTIKEEKRTRG